MTTAEQMPEPAFRLKWRNNDAGYFVDKPNIGDTDCYTFDQLRAYAAQEVARERAKHIVKLERHEFEATDLLRRLVENLPKQRYTVYWATVRDASGLGSTCAAALAEWAGRNAETGARNA